MNAEALIGTVLGNCTLQRLIGQGGMGAVYLAQQARPRRQVAVKVLLPMTPLSPHQLAAFLERFRRETDAAASLEHPNITPVYEYGERDGLAYLVMPYISAGTLRDEMERLGPLPMESVARYLDQMAAALDFAHERGVIHRDIKPANILMTPEGRLLLTDFGLVKIIAEGPTPQIRLTGAGAPVGTPDYMAPEQVIGEAVDARADLYSLGVILYQMVTGTTPFQGEVPMQIAAQHLQVPPPAPQMYRPDLPASAEQVMLRALAKRPADRFASAQELSDAFNMALMDAGIQLTFGLSQSSGRLKAARPAASGMTGQFLAPKNPFDPGVQTGTVPTVGANNGLLGGYTGSFKTAGGGLLSGYTGTTPAANGSGLLSGMTGTTPAANGGGLLSRATGMSPTPNGSGLLSRSMSTNAHLPTPQVADTMSATGATGAMPPAGGGLLSRTGKFPLMGGNTGALPASTYGAPDTPVSPTPGGTGLLSSYSSQFSAVAVDSPSLKNTTGSMAAFSQQPLLTSPLKVVKVPVAGQPGQYVTGLLPVAPPLTPDEILPTKKKKKTSLVMMITAVVMTVLLLAGAAGGTFWYLQMRPAQPASTPPSGQLTNTNNPGDPKATGTAQTQATAQANVILEDALNENVHNWLTSPPDVYSFKDGAYHIAVKGDTGRVTVLQTNPFNTPLVYTLTMQEVKGNDTSPNNSFGMVFAFSQKTSGNTTVTKFYSFEVVNMKGGEYQFWKYDDEKSKGKSAWAELWHQPFNEEFHYGQGPKASNTFQVTMENGKFTFIINGKAVKTMQDTSFSNGTVGMIVNQEGTEVAFKNLRLTRNLVS